MEFRGGQISENCSQNLKPAEKFVIEQLTVDHWYDFVLHTKWTTEEGGPGHSASSVWIDGKQVFGNQSIPISVPPLTWRETPEGKRHSTDAYVGFGLYRGRTEENPRSHLYIDAIRTGNSYEEVAPSV
jgi:hypothetical protein